MFKIDHSEVVHKNVHGWLYAYAESNNKPIFGTANCGLVLPVIGLLVEKQRMLG